MKIYLIIVIILFYFFQACQPGTLTRDSQSSSISDSLLFPEQVDINDPFLDTIFQNPGQTVTLHKKIFPAQIPPSDAPIYKEIEGFRIQVFAGFDSLNALAALVQAKKILAAKDSIYFIFENSLYKIQIGDYLYRYEADNERTKFTQNGFAGAWVVKRMILISITGNISGENDLNISDTKSGKYTIQIAAVSTEEKARQLVIELQQKSEYPAYYKHTDNLYHVYLGSFVNENDARAVLEQIKKSGYSDAWLVY